jgi:hypothetical protein
LGAEGEGLSFRPSGRRSDFGEENGFLGVAVADERWCKYFVGEGKLESRGRKSRRQFPVDGRRKTGVSWIGGIDVPTRFWKEAEANGEGLA